jgi:signal transduction histidine kinase
MRSILKNKSINKVNLFSVVFGSVLLAVFIVIAISNTYVKYVEDIEQLELQYVESQKKFIEQETKRVLRYIKFKHEKDKDKPIAELQAEIAEVIEQMRNERDGTGYVFIYTFDGINIADPILTENAGKNLIDFTDPNGKKVIYELIQVSKNEDGGYVNYVWNKPTTNTLAPKVSYAISFKPWKWMIGSGVYLDNIEDEIKKKKNEYFQQIGSYLFQTILIVSIVFIIGIMVYRYLMHIIQNDLLLIRKASQDLELIDINQVSFKEFKEVGKHLNSMNESLMDLNKNLEKKVEERTKELEESRGFALELVAKQDRFVKDAIHEINTPLGIIIANIDLFNMKHGKNKYLSKIEAGSKIIHNIYNDLEYMIKKDRIDYPKSVLSLSKFTNERVDFFSEIAFGNGLRFQLSIENGIDININDILLQRIIDNTLSNAIKYSFIDKEIKVNLYRDGENIFLDVINASKTIQEPHKLFDRFYREDDARGGFGIGLSIIKEVCDDNGIDVEVLSRDELTTFRYNFKNL